jgi:hypothetical protein
MSKLESFLLPHPIALVSATVTWPLPEAYARADVNARIVCQLASFVVDLLKYRCHIEKPHVLVGDNLTFVVYPETDMSFVARSIHDFLSAP